MLHVEVWDGDQSIVDGCLDADDAWDIMRYAIAEGHSLTIVNGDNDDMGKPFVDIFPGMDGEDIIKAFEWVCDTDGVAVGMSPMFV